MPNVRLVVEYDGSGFHGWQKQPGVRTVQEELHKALELVLREKLRFIAASGRTDTGVHAKGQVVNFHCQAEPDLRRLKHSVSSLLKGELSITAAEMVADDFHSCKSTKRKQYTYTTLHREAPAVLDKGQVWHLSRDLDLAAMRAAAAEIVGLHDFTSLRAANCESPSACKRILESEISAGGGYLRYRVVGEGFLKQMVRITVGTLVRIGCGHPATMRQILDARDRRAAGPTAPAHGLCLDWVEY